MFRRARADVPALQTNAELLRSDLDGPGDGKAVMNAIDLSHEG